MQSHSYFHLPATLLMILTALTLAKSVSIYKQSAKINHIWLERIALKKESLSIQVICARAYNWFRKLFFPYCQCLKEVRNPRQHFLICKRTSGKKNSAYSIIHYFSAVLVASMRAVISHNNYSEHLYYTPAQKPTFTCTWSFQFFSWKENCSTSTKARLLPADIFSDGYWWEQQRGRCHYAYVGALCINTAIHLMSPSMVL